MLFPGLHALRRHRPDLPGYVDFGPPRTDMMYAIRYGMAEVADCLKSEFQAVEAELAEISKHIGAG
jgi:hypothetical protein